MNQESELKSIFQRQFENVSETAPQSVWGGLETQLAQLKTKRRRKWLVYWSSSILLIAITVGTFLFLTNNRPNSTNHTNAASLINKNSSNTTRHQSEPNSNVSEQNQSAEKVDSNVLDGQPNNAFKKQSNFDQKQHTIGQHQKSADAKSNKTDTQFQINQTGNSLKSHKTTLADHTDEFAQSNTKTNQNNSTSNAAVLTQTGNTQNGIKTEKNPAEDDLTSASTSSENQLKNTANPNLTTEKRPDKTLLMAKMGQKPALKLPVKLNPMPEIIISSLPPQKSNWELSFYSGGGRQIRKTTLNNDNISNTNFSSLRPNRQLFHGSGLRISYFLGDHFSIGTGFETSVWRYRTQDYQKQLSLQENYEFDSPVGQLPATASDFSSFYDAAPETDTLLFKIHMIQHLRYVGLPLSFQYNFGTGNIKPYMRMGFVGNFLVRQRTTLIAENSGIEREVNYRNIEGFKRFQLTMQPAFGVNWQLNKRLTFYCEGLMNLPITKFYTPPSVKYQKISSQGVGVNLGIRLNFLN